MLEMIKLLKRVIEESSEGKYRHRREIPVSLITDIENFLSKQFKEEMIFGVGDEEDCPDYNDNDNYVIAFVCPKKIWEEEGCCADYTPSDVYETLIKCGFTPEEDAIFSPPKNNTKQETIQNLLDLGFKHDKDFELFVTDF